MSKSQPQPQPQDIPPPPPYEEIESGRDEAETGTGPVDLDIGENTPLLGRIAHIPYTHNRLWRCLKAILMGGVLVLILGTAVNIIGGMGDEVWKKRVGVVGQCIFYLGF
jgi:hypothetical protein